jgi:carbamoyl-phosphate synthase large subunit
MNILITSAGRRVSLVKAFKKEISRYIPGGKIFTVDMRPELSSACRISDGYFPVIKATDPLYTEVLIDICRKNNIKLIIPTIDTELIPLGRNKELFSSNDIEVVISSLDVILMCRDKRKVHAFFDSIGLSRPREIDIKKPEFPLFAKPVDGSSSIGAGIINDPTQLSESLIRNSSMLFMEYLSPEQYVEFTVDLYFDRKHYLKCAVPRERIEVRTGEVSKGLTRRDDLYDLICSMFAFCPGFKGCITLQIFRKNETNEVLGIEINPRFGGGYPLSYHAGANYPEYLIREYLMDESILFFDNWSKDMLMLRYDDEIIINDYKG